MSNIVYSSLLLMISEKCMQKSLEKSLKSIEINTVKLGYNELGYNEQKYLFGWFRSFLW
jgi:hypothetical protein